MYISRNVVNTTFVSRNFTSMNLKSINNMYNFFLYVRKHQGNGGFSYITLARSSFSFQFTKIKSLLTQKTFQHRKTCLCFMYEQLRGRCRALTRSRGWWAVPWTGTDSNWVTELAENKGERWAGGKEEVEEVGEVEEVEEGHEVEVKRLDSGEIFLPTEESQGDSGNHLPQGMCLAAQHRHTHTHTHTNLPKVSLSQLPTYTHM